MIAKILKLVLTGVAPIFMLAAYLSTRDTQIPLPSKFYDGQTNDKDVLVIFLPGRGDNIDAFERGGFIDVLRSSTRPLDAVVVDSHLGYYIERSLATRIGDDIIQPYRAKGYSKFILVGISLGGVGALKIQDEFRNDIIGVVLLAPYLGSKSTIRSIRGSGGVQQWRAQIDTLAEPDGEIWIWVDNAIDDRNKYMPHTILAYGEKDKFANSNGFLAEYLPESHVFTNSGGHKWTAWGLLWSDITSNTVWKKLGDERQPLESDSVNSDQKDTQE